MANLKLKVVTPFPSKVLAGDGISIDKEAGVYTVALDPDYVLPVENGGTGGAGALPSIQPGTEAGVSMRTEGFVFADENVTFTGSGVYPLSAVTANPIVVGHAGITIGATSAITYGLRFRYGTTDITVTVTGTTDPDDTLELLATAINANTTLHSATEGLPIFAQAIGSSTLNVQYSHTLSASGAFPLTLDAAGAGAAAFTIPTAVDIFDFAVMQLGRAVPGRVPQGGDSLFALDFTGQSSTGFLDTHYAVIAVSATDVTTTSQQGRITFSVANDGAAADGVMLMERGMVLFTEIGGVATTGDMGFGTINAPGRSGSGGYWLDGVNKITRNSGSGQFIIQSTGTDDIVLSSGGTGGIGLEATPTGGALSVGRGVFISGSQVVTDSTNGLGIIGGATPTIAASNPGTTTALPLAFSGTVYNFAGTAAGPAELRLFEDTDNGTNYGGLIAPASMAGNLTWTLPNATDTLVGKDTTDTLTNKTLTAPKFATLGFIADANGNELITFVTGTSAVNELRITNGGTGVNPKIEVTGDDADRGLTFQAKGASPYVFAATTTAPTTIRWSEQTTNGSNFISVAAPTAITANQVMTLPEATDTFVGKATVDEFTNKTFDTAGTGNAFKIGGSAATTAAQIQAILAQPFVFVKGSVNFNSANTDTSFTIALPTGFTRYTVSTVMISGASGTLTTATAGLFTSTGGGGTAIVTGGSAITVNTASENTNNNMMILTVINGNTNTFTAATLQFRVATAQGSTATATVTLVIRPVS